jgi:PAS domain S-box-containing protein
MPEAIVLKRSMLKDIKKNHFWGIVFFSLFVILLAGLLLWQETIESEKERLFTLTRTIALAVNEYRDLIAGEDENKLQQKLRPYLQNLIQDLPWEQTAGFYSREPGRIMAGVPDAPPVKVETATLPLDDPGRKSRFLPKPQYKLSWSPVRGTWFLRCDYPVIINSRVIGHTFAGISLSPAVFKHEQDGIILTIIIILAGCVSFIVSSRTSRKIEININRLLLAGDDQSQPEFDYEEFERIARLNREAYQKINHTLESITDAFLAVDHECRFTYVNKAAELLLKRTADQLIGKTLWEEYPNDIGSEFHHQYQKLIQEQKAAHFAALSAATQRWIEVHAYPSSDGLSVYFRDITQRKICENKIKQLAVIVEYSEDAIFSMDLDGLITSWNPAAEKMYGYSPAEIIGQSAANLIALKDRRLFPKMLAATVQGLGLDHPETVRVRKNGASIHVSVKHSLIKDESGKAIGISSIHRDISEKKQFEDGLKAERERLQVTLDSIGDGVIATNQEEKVVLMNKSAENLTGWTFPDWTEQPLAKVFYIMDDRSSEVYENLVQNMLRSDDTLNLRNTILVNKDLREIPVSIRCAPIKQQHGKFFGAVFVFQDITEKMKTEAELLKAEKLESLGILAGGIAHDFNNILAAVIANLQLAMMKLDKGQDIRKYLTDLVETTLNASELTKQLLTFSRGGAPVKKTASMVELIRDTAQFALRGSKAGLNFLIPVDLWPVEIDEGQISQVIHNLIINANQAMPRGGIIEINAENFIAESGSRFNPGRFVKISIKDQGIGIPKENLNKIFDPFFTTKNEGSGLGLASSYSIIRRHDGYIEVESVVNTGTTFLIYLPASTQDITRPIPENEVAVAGEGTKILLMDDEENILKVVGEMLEYSGYRVALAKDGVDAIGFYREALYSGDPFEVVIMDLTVPGGMGGQEAIAHLRDIDPRVKTIVSSGYANDPVMADFERFGFCGVVAKPFKLNDLNAVLRKVLEEK